MAQLRDLIVNGASRLIGDAYTNKIQINTISAYSDSGKTTYGLGNSGQILKSDGANVYWANDNNFESLSYDYTTNPSKNTLRIKVNNNEKTCELLMKGLTIGDKTYYGNQAVEIGITDLGLTKAMTFRGITDTVLTDKATTSPVSIIGGSNLTPAEGDVVLYKTDSQEFVWSGGQWHLLGLASSFALQNHIHGNISNDGKLKINNTIAPNKSVVTNSTGDITAKEQHFIFKGTCATAAGTAVKAVTCADFTSTDLVKGAAIAVVFDNTNSAAVANLKLNVNSTGEKPIRYMYNNAVNNIPAVGYLLANQTYLFHYDGTYWVIDNMHYNTDNNTLQRVWGSTTNIELPIAGLNTANSGTATFTNMASLSYRAYYGAIPNVTTDRPTLNPSTGFITSNLLLKKLKGTQNVTYGTALPASPEIGDFFFLADEDAAGDSLNSQKVMVEPSTEKSYVLGSLDPEGGSVTPTLNTSVYTEGTVLYGAAWNDYAEYRETNNVLPGNCVIENGDGSLSLSTQRMQPGAAIVTDTFGFIIGETEKAKTPIAVSGRVLAYTYEDRQSFVIGQPVCSGPNGTISKMTDEEARNYPWLIIGIVSEIPNYSIWNNKINVNNRIWIKVW